MVRPHGLLFGTPSPFVVVVVFIYCITFNQISQVDRVDLFQNDDGTDVDSLVITIGESQPLASREGQVTNLAPNDIRTSQTIDNQAWWTSYPALTYNKVPLEPEETFMWKGRQRKLCKRIKKEFHKSSRTVLYFGLPCQKLHQQHRHGNLLFGLYAMHVAAAAHDADLIFVCQEKEFYENIFWWVQSLPYSIEEKRHLLLSEKKLPDPSSTCAGMGKIPVQYATRLIQHDLRRMALSISGPRTLPMKQYAIEHVKSSSTGNLNKRDRLPSQPLHPEMELDSVAIHFRCGDLLGNLNADMNDNYGMMPFYVYKSILQNATTSIGIITAPFDPKHLRKQDARHGRQCQELVETFRDYLQEHAPRARITIRNDPTETIPMVFSRLVLADQASICIRSTFCILPTLASFAQNRIFLEGGVSYFVSHLKEEGLFLLHSNSTPYIYSHEIHQMGWNATMEWLLQDESWHTRATNFDPEQQ